VIDCVIFLYAIPHKLAKAWYWNLACKWGWCPYFLRSIYMWCVPWHPLSERYWYPQHQHSKRLVWWLNIS